MTQRPGERARVLVLLAILLGSSVTAAAGIWKRIREREIPPAPALPAGAPAGPAWHARPTGSPARGGAAAQVDAASGTFRGDARRRHRSPHAGPAEATLARSIAVGAPIAAMPIVTPDGDVIVATLGGKVARISPAGDIVWTASLGDAIYGAPLVQQHLLMVGTDGDRFVALTMSDGKERWSAPVKGDCDTSPAEGPEGLVLVAAHDTLYAMRQNGIVAWRARAHAKIRASPAVGEDGTIYFGSQDDHLYAVSPKGQVRWRRDLGASVDCTAAVGDGGRIYVGSDAGEVVSFDADGALRFRVKVGGFVRGGLTVTRDGAVVAGTYGPAPRVVALDPDTGAERWSFRIQGKGARERGVSGGPLEDADGNLYVGAQDHRIYALDRAGALRWTYAAGGEVSAPLALGPGGVLYVGAEDGVLYALR